jgi:type I restriction enzyme S subunit
MALEWPVITFGELIQLGELEIGDGYRAKNSELTGDGLIFLRAGHVTDTHIDFNGTDRFCTTTEHTFGPKISRPGDVIVTTKGNSTGRIAFVTSDMPRFVYSPHLSYWRAAPKGRLEQAFLRAWSRSTQFSEQLAALSRSTDMAPYLSLTDQRTLSVTIPPRPIQRWVGALNDSVDQRLQLLRQTNTSLETIAQALFKSWFVDFDPVHAKAEGREPDGMDVATAALFPDSFEDSPLGPIPQRWRAGTFGDLAILAKGSINPLHAPDTVFEHYSLPAFDVGGWPVFELGACIMSNKTRVPQGAVLQSKLNPRIPRVWLLGYVGDWAVCSTEFLPWIPRSHASSSLLYCLLQSAGFAAAVLTLVTGTSNSHQRVKPDQVAALPTVVPDGALVAAFDRTVKPLLDQTLANRQRMQTLTQLRDTLLPRLISGKLRLPEAQTLIAEASP